MTHSAAPLATRPTTTRHGQCPTGMGTVNAQIGGCGATHLATQFTYADGTTRLGWTHCGAYNLTGGHLVVTTAPADCPRCTA